MAKVKKEEEVEVVEAELIAEVMDSYDVLAGKSFAGKTILKSYPKSINGKEIIAIDLDDATTTVYEADLK